MRWPSGDSRFRWCLASVLIAGWFGVEAAYLGRDGAASRTAAAYFWVGSAGALLLGTWMVSLTPFFRTDFWRDPARWWYVAAAVLTPALVLVDAGGIRFTTLDFEGAEQMEIALRYLQRSDLGIYHIGYVGCLNRATMLNALPSLALGRTLWALRLGNAMVYLGSYAFFLATLEAYLRHRRSPDPVRFAAYAGMMIALGGYALEVTRKFEQTSGPIAYTLLFAGFLLLYLARPGPLCLAGLVWSFGVLPYVYTPALATWFLGGAAFLFLAIRDRRGWPLLPLAYGAVTLVEAMVITARSTGFAQRFIITQPTFTLGDHLWHYATGLRVPISADFSLIPPPLALAGLALLAVSWRRRQWLFPLVCLWAAGAAFAAVAFIGSNYAYGPFSMHRSLMMLVPLALGVTLWLSRLLAEDATRRWIRPALNLSMAYMVLTSVSLPFTVRSFFGMGVQTPQEEMMVDIFHLAQGPRPPTRILLAKELGDLNQDAARYFVPGIEIYREEDAPKPNLPGTYRLSYLPDASVLHVPDEIVPSHAPSVFIKVEAL